MAQFNKGDVVRLKSGGPAMTVSFVDDKGKLECWWFPTPTSDKPAWVSFQPECVTLVKT